MKSRRILSLVASLAILLHAFAFVQHAGAMAGARGVAKLGTVASTAVKAGEQRVTVPICHQGTGAKTVEIVLPAANDEGSPGEATPGEGPADRSVPCAVCAAVCAAVAIETALPGNPAPPHGVVVDALTYASQPRPAAFGPFRPHSRGPPAFVPLA